MATQQDQEEGTTHDGGNGAHWKLASHQQCPRHGVAQHQEGGAAEGRRGNQETVIGTEEEAQQVGNDQTHEADQPGYRYRCADHQRGCAEQHPLGPLHIDAELRRGLLAERQQVQPPGQGKGAGEAQRQEGRHPARQLEARIREVSDQPEEDAGPLHQTGHGGQEDDGGRCEGVEDDTGEEQRGGREPSGPAGDGEQQENGQDGSGEGGGRDRGVAETEGAAEHQHGDPAEGGTTRDAEDVGIGERVAEQRLEERARHRQGSADQRGEHDPRQADAEHDVGAGPVGLPGQGVPHLGDGERARTDGQTESHGEGEQGAEAQQHRPHSPPRQYPHGPGSARWLTTSGPWIAAAMASSARSR